MTQNELRYYFEHKILPKYFFEDTEPFLTEMLDALDKEVAGNIIYEMISDIAKKNDTEFADSENEYEAELFWLKEEDYIIRIRLPEPEESLLCAYIYLLFSLDDLSKLRYFTVELLEKKRRKNVYCLCEWEQDGFHRNHSFVSKNLEKIQDKIIQMYEEQ